MPSFNSIGDYSLEIRAKVNSTTAKGLDIDTRNAGGLTLALPINTPSSLSASNNIVEQL